MSFILIVHAVAVGGPPRPRDEKEEKEKKKAEEEKAVKRRPGIEEQPRESALGAGRTRPSGRRRRRGASLAIYSIAAVVESKSGMLLT